MESEDDIDMQDANNESGDDDFYSGGDDEAAALALYDDSDADIADYEFIDNDSDDSDILVSHRHQVRTGCSVHAGVCGQDFCKFWVFVFWCHGNCQKGMFFNAWVMYCFIFGFFRAFCFNLLRTILDFVFSVSLT